LQVSTRQTVIMASFRAAVSAVRAFSTSSRQAQLVQAKIQVFGQEGRYAHALYSAAAKSSALEAVEADLATVGSLIQSNAALNSFLVNPSVQRKEKTELVKSILAETEVSALCKNLFIVMAENGALNKWLLCAMDNFAFGRPFLQMPGTTANGVIAAYNKIMRAERGEVEVVVTTAKELSGAQLENLNGALAGFLKGGEVIKLTTAVDPALIGGMTVSIGDKFVDMSIATKIKTYTNLIKQGL